MARRRECSWCGEALFHEEVAAHDCQEPETFIGTNAYKVADGNGYRAGTFTLEQPSRPSSRSSSPMPPSAE